ncbi:ribbon-helix-helix domain-containing protein [Salinarimonas soli]|uniref:Antitoxin-like ribbon-helix-helix domain-containing protein n=1 Tax=Salinarimonas soli TaxID=1638099 RepID=A0A5B2VR98_9HYPH|nr:ribbon-helix-helix domain-containing protein [Salinarimonas soli]KAA2241120.1 hypothetical protein F0L46_04800 [Salinarimonas soli]
MSKPPKLSLKSIVAASVSSSVQGEHDAIQLPPALSPSSMERLRPLKERAKQMSVYLEPAVHDQLRDIAHAERKKMHALMLEGLDLLFKKRGASSIKQLNARVPR